jgi:hypothetical protein
VPGEAYHIYNPNIKRLLRYYGHGLVAPENDNSGNQKWCKDLDVLALENAHDDLCKKCDFLRAESGEYRHRHEHLARQVVILNAEVVDMHEENKRLTDRLARQNAALRAYLAVLAAG